MPPSIRPPKSKQDIHRMSRLDLIWSCFMFKTLTIPGLELLNWDYDVPRGKCLVISAPKSNFGAKIVQLRFSVLLDVISAWDHGGVQIRDQCLLFGLTSRLFLVQPRFYSIGRISVKRKLQSNHSILSIPSRFSKSITITMNSALIEFWLLLGFEALIGRLVNLLGATKNASQSKSIRWKPTGIFHCWIRAWIRFYGVSRNK